MTLTEKEVQDLTNFANEMPTKFGMPLLQFLNAKQQAEQQDAEQAKKELETTKLDKK